MQKIFLFLLFNSTVILAQNQYPETQNLNSMSGGVYYQTGPGSNNGTLNWTYPYGTKLTVLGNASRNFELSTSGYPYGNLKIRQWDPFNNVWTSWRDVLATDQYGNVGIGTSSPDSKLTVKGKIHAEEVKIDLSVPGADYVFEEGYQLMSLEDIRQYIKEHGHLPNIPSAKDMEENGVELGVMNMKLLEKIEELTLFILNQQREIEKNSGLEIEVECLKIQNMDLAKRLEALENR